jgi:diketogulonate reductase-like aldo/keto reductase
MQPAFVYGTAWKEERTEELVRRALACGFRAIDTANQRKHYVEAAVGAAIRGLPRAELWLQTKFTHLPGQDDRLPYDPRAPIETQVAQSFASSLENLGTAYLDSYVLHGPNARHGLAPDDVGAWRAMEAIHARGGARQLGASNVTRDQLAELCRIATVPPAFVQNRCHARTGWDADVRAICRERGIIYQGFSLLTANRAELQRPAIDLLMQRTGFTRAQLVFRFALDVGMLPLTGTSSDAHMREDLAVLAGPPLAPADVATIERIGLAAQSS